MSRNRAITVAGLLAWRLLTLLVLLALIFVAIDVLPSDAARVALDSDASEADLRTQRTQLGLDQPVALRFLRWIGGLSTGNLGLSARGRPIVDIVAGPFPNTVAVGGLVLLLTVSVAVAIGAATVTAGKRLGQLVSVMSTAVLALPEFVVATAFIVVFALSLDVLPASTVTTERGAPASAAMLILPVCALALRQIGWNTRIVRAALAEQLRTPHVDSAILDGLPRHRVLFRYLLPGAVPTIAAGVATSVGMAFGGVVAVEAIFNFPGMGAVLIDAIRNRDAPVVAAVVALTGSVITVVLVFSDLLRANTTGGAA